MPPDEFDHGNVCATSDTLPHIGENAFTRQKGPSFPPRRECIALINGFEKNGRKAIKLIRKPLFDECLVGSACRARLVFQ